MPKVNLKQKLVLVAGVVIFLLVCGAGYLLIHKDTNSSQSSSTSTTGTSNRIYTSAMHEFSVNFHGEPTLSNAYLLFKLGGQDIRVPFTMYKRDDGKALYEVTVYEYPAEFYMSKDVDARLQAALNGVVQNFKSAKLVNSSFGEFKGYRAINGVASVNSDNITHDIYTTVFLKGNTLYSLLSIDANQTAFNAFANTFQLNKK